MFGDPSNKARNDSKSICDKAGLYSLLPREKNHVQEGVHLRAVYSKEYMISSMIFLPIHDDNV